MYARSVGVTQSAQFEEGITVRVQTHTYYRLSTLVYSHMTCTKSTCHAHHNVRAIPMMLLL